MLKLELITQGGKRRWGKMQLEKEMTMGIDSSGQLLQQQ